MTLSFPKILARTAQAIHARCIRTYAHTLRGAERLFGPGILPWMVAPVVGCTLLRRFSDYPQFRRLRASRPVPFWKGVSPFRHFVRMFRNWEGSIATIFFYDRMQSPAWRRNFRVIGTPPHRLPDWERRPVVLAFMHVGGFAVPRYWLRAQGVAAANFVGGYFPSHFYYTEKFRDAADRAYGFQDIPHGFIGSNSLRQAIQFLRPKRALLVALEQRYFSKPTQPYHVSGSTICLSDGAFRLAAATNAILLPVTVYQTGTCRFEIKFGQPVPDDLIKNHDVANGNQHLLVELWRDLEEDPSAMTWTTLEALAPDKIAYRQWWP